MIWPSGAEEANYKISVLIAGMSKYAEEGLRGISQSSIYPAPLHARMV
jgi:hypothetical protein